MADRDTLLALADRVEAATGADFFLVRDVLRAVGWQVDRCGDVISPNGARSLSVPDPLTSLDATMGLVPEGWRLSMLSSTGPTPIIWSAAMWVLDPWTDVSPAPEGKAATPARALAAASLRARALAKETPDAN